MSEFDLAGQLMALLQNPFAGRGLSPEEEATARLAAFGRTQEQIAVELGIVRSTVAFRMKAICRILGCKARDLPGMLIQMIIDLEEEVKKR